MISIYNNIDGSMPCEHVYTLNDVIVGLGYDIGLKDYPVFDESYRASLNAGIVDHFRYRRIASETPAMFVFMLNRRMREQMPAYNALYREVMSETFDALDGGTTRIEQHETGTHGSTGRGTSEQRNIASSTPATYINDPDGEQYMDTLTRVGVTSETEDAGTSASDYARVVTSRLGWADAADVLTSGLLNVDALVFGMLEPCFLQFWDDMPDY